MLNKLKNLDIDEKIGVGSAIGIVVLLIAVAQGWI